MAQVKDTKLVRSLRRGQITIPAEFMRQLGITDDSVLQMTIRDGELRIKPVRVVDSEQGPAWFYELWEYFAPVREEADAKGYSDEEINAWIDEALAAVRR
jgi:bifunctional DNA-binding transcriptional regulator/antitoxin component of YhaV-PrlF toxin-antitoxin module